MKKLLLFVSVFEAHTHSNAWRKDSKMSTKQKNLSIRKAILKEGRFGGIILHPTSLPSKYGIGDFGLEAYQFIDFMHNCHLSLWQILPFGPTGYGNSPYQSFSTFAGNPLLINPQKLQEMHLLGDIDVPHFPDSRVDFSKVIPYKYGLLNEAFNSYLKKPTQSISNNFIEFKKTNHYWLEDYALYMSIKEVHDLQPWIKWEEPLKLRNEQAINSWKNKYEREIEFYKFIQYLFFEQWNEIRSYCHKKDVLIIGDIPIFVAYDSADVWAHPELYFLDNKGELLYVAGVPPDYFSETGQRWGNPLYRWDLMEKNGYKWWIQRIKHCFSLVDILRIDHFRGFEAYWKIPAEESTAVNGEWVNGPGIKFFNSLKASLGNLPIIAENLGIITPAVDKMLNHTGYPGMRVLQFAFGDYEEEFIENLYLPHNYIPNTVVYTGTHDNDTTLGWFQSLPSKIKNYTLEYLNSNGKDIVGDLIRLAWSSVARVSIIPLQDLLRLGPESRMNLPGSSTGNWEWRFKWDQLSPERSKEMLKLNNLYERLVSPFKKNS